MSSSVPYCRVARGPGRSWRAIVPNLASSVAMGERTSTEPQEDFEQIHAPKILPRVDRSAAAGTARSPIPLESHRLELLCATSSYRGANRGGLLCRVGRERRHGRSVDARVDLAEVAVVVAQRLHAPIAELALAVDPSGRSSSGPAGSPSRWWPERGRINERPRPKICRGLLRPQSWWLRRAAGRRRRRACRAEAARRPPGRPSPRAPRHRSAGAAHAGRCGAARARARAR
jgi:hypothetical protein